MMPLLSHDSTQNSLVRILPTPNDIEFTVVVQPKPCTQLLANLGTDVNGSLSHRPVLPP